ncbi:FixH family protein [Reichenbachiella sp.]|uniref:FixH family protein n=1 Tax=Reichenbachiella sp. TaxID=2184521 RepID=UPI003BB19A8B
MNWGKSIVLAFVIFAGIIITMVSISMQHDVNLVAVNYYEEELAYEDQMNRIRNYESLRNKPMVKKDGNQIVLSFPSEVADQMKDGEIHFFRPSDYKSDKKIEIKLDHQYRQTFPVSLLGSGLWKTKLNWKSKDKEYFFEQKIVL